MRFSQSPSSSGRAPGLVIKLPFSLETALSPWPCPVTVERSRDLGREKGDAMTEGREGKWDENASLSLGFSERGGNAFVA